MKAMKILLMTLLLIALYSERVSAITAKACQQLFVISVNTNEGIKFGYIDSNGRLIVEPKYLMASYFSDGVGIVEVERKKVGNRDDGRPIWGGTDGIVDIYGNIIEIPNSNIFSDFSEGLALARINGRLVYIDKSGNVKISIPDEIKVSRNEEYSTPEEFPFTDGVAGLRADDGGLYLIDKSGNITHTKKPHYYYDENGLAIIEIEGKYAIINKNGGYIVGPQDNEIVGDDGIYFMIPKDKNEKYKFLNSKGKIIFEIFLNDVGFFSEGLIRVQIGDKWGYIDKVGKIIIPAKFDVAEDFSEGAAAVKLKNKWGFIDRRGRLIIPSQIDNVNESFNCGLARVEVDEVNGYIDKRGNWVWKEK